MLGFCSPGFVMSTNRFSLSLGSQSCNINKYILNCSLLKSEQRPSLARVEEQLMGNICRCTGYRPILDAMKSFAGSCESRERSLSIPDIEDLDSWVELCPGPESGCRVMRMRGKTWMTPTSLESLLQQLQEVPDSYKLLSGNTGSAILQDSPDLSVIIDISQVAELKAVQRSPLQVGGGVTITDAVAHFQSIQEQDPASYKYLKTMSDNLVYLAGPAVRDMASVAGNLMIKHKHHNFPSDIFSMLEALGAKITIASHSSGGKIQTSEYSLAEWLDVDMKRKVILHISLPPKGTNCKFQFFKVSPRSSFAVAHVNGAFCAEFDKQDQKTIKRASFVFGGVSGNFVHPSNTEAYIVGKDLTRPDVMNKLFELLSAEVVVDDEPHLTSGEFRAGLVSALLYKFLLWSLQDSGIVDEKKESFAHNITTEIFY